jgi:3-dehydroquinate dehydratase type I
VHIYRPTYLDLAMYFYVQVAAKLLNLMSGKKQENVKLIISSHNYEMTPSVEELGNMAASIQSLGADIVKIATTANDISDVSRMFQLIVHSQVSINSSIVPFLILIKFKMSCPVTLVFVGFIKLSIGTPSLMI